MNKNQTRKLVAFLYEIGSLRRILRMHQPALFWHDPTDNISSHSFRAAFIGYFLAKALKADADKVLKMCLLHDLEEARCGDHNWINRKYIKVFEEEIREGQLKELPASKELLEISKEYHARKTPEAKIAKDADLLDEIFLLKEFEFQGSKEAIDWLKGTHNKGPGGQSQQEKLMKTRLAKDIARAVKKQRPSQWWEYLWTSKRRK